MGKNFQRFTEDSTPHTQELSFTWLNSRVPPMNSLHATGLFWQKPCHGFCEVHGKFLPDLSYCYFWLFLNLTTLFEVIQVHSGNICRIALVVISPCFAYDIYCVYHLPYSVKHCYFASALPLPEPLFLTIHTIIQSCKAEPAL